MIGLDEFLQSKEAERNQREFKDGWSPFKLTNKGDEQQGWIRFFNSESSMSFEPFRQIVFMKDDGSYQVCEGEDEMKFIPYAFDSQSEAMEALKHFTIIGMFDDVPAFDPQRYSAWVRCLEHVEGNPMLEDHAKDWLEDEFSNQQDLLSYHENGEICKRFWKVFGDAK